MRTLYLILLWPLSVLAADTFADEIRAFGWESIGLIVLFSALAGMPSAIRNTENPEISSPFRRALYSLSVSILAGGALYALSMAAGASFGVRFAALIAGGWGGAKILDTVTRRFSAKESA